jgi:DnaJ family protein C protein 9
MHSGLVASLEKHFGTRSLYIALGLPEDRNPAGESAWTDEELKRAYRKQALAVHPDRATEENRSEATERFQAVCAAYKLLSDGDRRAAYDETGEIDENEDSNILKEEKDWDLYWRLLFKVR